MRIRQLCHEPFLHQEHAQEHARNREGPSDVNKWWSMFKLQMRLRFRKAGVYAVMQEVMDHPTSAEPYRATPTRAMVLDLNDGSKQMEDLILASWMLFDSVDHPLFRFYAVRHPHSIRHADTLRHPHWMWRTLER